MTVAEILTAFHLRRAHYDAYLQGNDIAVRTCGGCGFPTIVQDDCLICYREEDLAATRIDIGRMLESYEALIDGEVDFDTARVLQTIAFYQQRRHEIEDRITGDERPQDHIWIEYNEVKKDLLMSLVVPKL